MIISSRLTSSLPLRLTLSLVLLLVARAHVVVVVSALQVQLTKFALIRGPCCSRSTEAKIHPIPGQTESEREFRKRQTQKPEGEKQFWITKTVGEHDGRWEEGKTTAARKTSWEIQTDRKLGSGNFGSVVLAKQVEGDTTTLGGSFAVKMEEKSPRKKKSCKVEERAVAFLTNEKNILNTLQVIMSLLRCILVITPRYLLPDSARFHERIQLYLVHRSISYIIKCYFFCYISGLGGSLYNLRTTTMLNLNHWQP